MKRVGIKELKAKLSGYIERVRKGEQIVITDHGEEAGIIIPISKERSCVISLMQDGKAHWSGDKPRGIKGIKVKGKPISEIIIEERV